MSPSERKSGPKGGRPAKYVVDPKTGRPIDGLSYNKILGQFYVTHSKPRRWLGHELTLAKFKLAQWKTQQEGPTAHVTTERTLPLSVIQDIKGVPREVRRLSYGHDLRGGPSPTAPIPITPELIEQIKDQTGKTDVQIAFDLTPSDEWEYIRSLILSDVREFSRRVGLNIQVMDRPEPSLTLEQVDNLYHDHREATKDWKRKARQFWSEFAKAVQPATTVADVTVDQVRNYRDSILAKYKAGDASRVYVGHRFRCITTMLRYSEREGHSSTDLTNLLHACRMLVPPKKNANDSKAPHPISRDDYHKLLDTARDHTFMTSVLLLGLNCGMYPSELLALDKSDINLSKGTLVTARSKTGVVRVGVLWERTRRVIEAHLKATAANQTDALYVTMEGRGKGKRTHVMTLRHWFRQLRAEAKVDESVKLEDLRDGAQTAAIERGADPMHTKILLGHACGIDDAYLKRNPRMVADACDAIYAHYLAPLPKGRKKKL